MDERITYVGSGVDKNTVKDGFPVMLAVLWNVVVLPNSHDKPGRYTLAFRMKLFFDNKSNNKNIIVLDETDLTVDFVFYVLITVA
ncbi:MAG: hypothetical protein ACR5LD_07030 [Symbiopectobacterium sp.]